MDRLVIGDDSTARLPILFALEEDLADGGRCSLLSICPLILLLETPGDCFQYNGFGSLAAEGW